MFPNTGGGSVPVISLHLKYCCWGLYCHLFPKVALCSIKSIWSQADGIPVPALYDLHLLLFWILASPSVTLGWYLPPWGLCGTYISRSCGCSARGIAHLLVRGRGRIKLIILFCWSPSWEETLNFLLVCHYYESQLSKPGPATWEILGATNKQAAHTILTLWFFPGKTIQESSPEEFPLNKQKFASLLIFTPLEKISAFLVKHSHQKPRWETQQPRSQAEVPVGRPRGLTWNSNMEPL